jgi:hypothetical protein
MITGWLRGNLLTNSVAELGVGVYTAYHGECGVVTATKL